MIFLTLFLFLFVSLFDLVIFGLIVFDLLIFDPLGFEISEHHVILLSRVKRMKAFELEMISQNNFIRHFYKIKKEMGKGERKK